MQQYIIDIIKAITQRGKRVRVFDSNVGNGEYAIQSLTVGFACPVCPNKRL